MAFSWTNPLAVESIVSFDVLDEIRDNVDWLIDNPASNFSYNTSVETTKDATYCGTNNGTIDTTQYVSDNVSYNSQVDSPQYLANLYTANYDYCGAHYTSYA